MPENNQAWVFARWLRIKIPTFFALALGVGAERKTALFLDLSRAATLRDIVYWLQIFFSAGIATLGLVLNSPAVIIGAMLISPLMNPILASGLALATGDIILGLRAFINLILSCGLAIGFAVLLVVILPFREMTSEIAARTQPNVLDLMIALFSGAVGSVAICREVKGVVTSIPGVAIAVALMPPLCIVGYGIGLMLVLDMATGWRIASGGGLLFLTNLVAITLTAMLVFLALRIDTPKVREQAEEWEQTDPESRFFINSMRRFPGLEKARIVHSLPLRVVMIGLPLILILIPLSSAFSQLTKEIARKQRESEIRQTVTDVWQDRFQKASNGVARSSIDHLAVSETDGKLNINLRVFDDEPYTLPEKKECAMLVAERLKRPLETINLKLTEIPTVSVLDAIERAKDEKQAAAAAALTPTFAEQEASLQAQAETVLNDLQLPENISLLDKQILMSATEPLRVKLIYLGENSIDPDTQNKIVGQIKAKLADDKAVVSMERIAPIIGDITFSRNRADIPIAGMLQLDFAGRVLRENSQLSLAVNNNVRKGEREDVADERLNAIADYLGSRWQIAKERIQNAVADGETKTTLGFQIVNSAAVPAQTAKVENPSDNLTQAK